MPRDNQRGRRLPWIDIGVIYAQFLVYLQPERPSALLSLQQQHNANLFALLSRSFVLSDVSIPN